MKTNQHTFIHSRKGNDMPKRATCIEVRSTCGVVLFTALVYEKDIDLPEQPSAPKPAVPQAKPDATPLPTNGKGQPRSQSHVAQQERGSEDPLMTESQKRYLFRILAGRGIEGNQAYDHLKKLLHVDTLKEATKQEASQVIDRLVQENAKGGVHYD
jgi:hypothetical protein